MDVESRTSGADRGSGSSARCHLRPRLVLGRRGAGDRQRRSIISVGPQSLEYSEDMKRIPPGAPGALLIGAVVLSAAAVIACGGGAASPTAAPTPAPTPVPVASATPDPNVPPAGSACGKPYPPPISRLSVKIHLKDNDYWTIDSTPLVGPDGEYCYAVGFTDGRTICPLRPEGARTGPHARRGGAGSPRTESRDPPGPTSSTAPGRRRRAAARRTRRATATRTGPTPSRRSAAGSTGCAPRRGPAPRSTSTATSRNLRS